MSDDTPRISPEDCYSAFTDAATALSRHDALVDVDRRVQHEESQRLTREIELDLAALRKLDQDIASAANAPAQPANPSTRTPTAVPQPTSVPSEVIQQTSYPVGISYTSRYPSEAYPFILVVPSANGGLTLCTQRVEWEADYVSAAGVPLQTYHGTTNSGNPELLLLDHNLPNAATVSLTVKNHRLALFSSMNPRVLEQSIQSAVGKLENIPLLRYAEWPVPPPGIILVPNTQGSAPVSPSGVDEVAETERKLDKAIDEATTQAEEVNKLVRRGSSEGETPNSDFHAKKIDTELREVLEEYMRPDGPFEKFVTEIANENPLQPGSSRAVGKLRALADEESKKKGATYRVCRDAVRKIVTMYLEESGKEHRTISYGQVLDTLEKFEDSVHDLLTHAEVLFAKTLRDGRVLTAAEAEQRIEASKRKFERFAKEYDDIRRLIALARTPPKGNT